MTRVPAGSCAAISADAPCGSARNTTSCPARLSTVVSSRIRSARPWRCGCNSPSLEPALLCGDGADGHVGMTGQEPQDLAAGVAACTGDGNRNSHSPEYTARLCIEPDIYACGSPRPAPPAPTAPTAR